MEYLLNQMLEYYERIEYQDKFAQMYGYDDWEDAFLTLPPKLFDEFEHLFETDHFYYDGYKPRDEYRKENYGMAQNEPETSD